MPTAGRTSNASSASSSPKQGCVFGGSIGTFDDVFQRIACGGQRRPAGRDRGAAAARARRAVAPRVAERPLRVRRAPPGFADTLREAIRELQGALLEPDRVEGDLAHLYAAYRAELDTLGLWDRELLRARRRRAPARATLDAWHGEPVFAYGFEDLTEAEWSLLRRARRPHRGDRLAAVRAGPRGVRRRCGEPPRTSRRSPDGRDRGAPRRRSPRSPRPRLAYLERSLFDEPSDTARRRSKAPSRFLEGAGVRGALELVGDGILGLVRGGDAPRGDRRRLPVARPLARAARDGLRNARHPVRVRGPHAARGDAVRPRAPVACFASRGSAAPVPTSSPSSARRTRGSAARTSTSSRGACAGGRWPQPESDRGGHAGAPRRTAAPARRACVPAERRRSTRCARSAQAMLRAAHGLEHPPVGTDPAERPPRLRRVRSACSTSSARGSGSSTSRRPPTTSSRRSSARGCAA